MTANDNLGGLSGAVMRAVDWAQTIPASVSIIEHPEFNQHFGSFSQEEFVAAMDELERRASAAESEANEIRAFVGERGE